AGGAWLVHRGVAADAAWGWLLLAAVLVDAVGWLATWWGPDGPGLLLATAGGTGALIAGGCVREARRLALVSPAGGEGWGGVALVEPAQGEGGGGVVFAAAVALGVAAMVWVVRIVRAAPEPAADGEGPMNRRGASEPKIG